MKKLTLLFSALILCSSVSARIWHVSPNGSDTNDGSAAAPVRTISKAAFYAIAGDTVLISEGIYRERVSPANTGFNDRRRVTYMAAPGEEVWLKGSEVVSGWKRESKKSNVWVAEIPNSLFGDFNPFSVEVYGDWLLEGKGLHLGEVYINGETLQEYLEEGEVATTQMSWFASVGDAVTTVKANFGDADPSAAMVEVNVRPTCFFPQTTGISYITVKGLKIAQAATQWSPPTGEQVGIIGPNWSKGWVIEDCEIMQSKCVGVCIGKDRSSGHNFSSLYKGTDHSKMGFTREIEAIFKAYELGWTYDNIGSHLIQNNVIHDCNQAGIVGHLGCSFSVIRGNEIYNINTDTPIGGHETGGIKLHGGIDVIIEGNVITNTRRGIWIDWQAQGKHVRNNVLEHNISEDIFVEVTHGPTLVYNNIMLSDRALLLRAQGTAFFNNIIGGGVNAGSSAAGRYTPYHQPHSTAIKGFHNNPGGDWHFYNNIFLAQADGEIDGAFGLDGCSAFPASVAEYKANLSSGHESMGVLTAKFPILMDANVYFGSASVAHRAEEGYTRYADKEITATLEKREDGHYYLSTNLDAADLKGLKSLAINTEMLGEVIIPELLYENPDGTEFFLTTDFFGKARNSSAPFVGPFEGAFDASIPVW